jgi:hypothetical protein
VQCSGLSNSLAWFPRSILHLVLGSEKVVRLVYKDTYRLAQIDISQGALADTLFSDVSSPVILCARSSPQPKEIVQPSCPGFVALTWNGHNEPGRQGHSGRKTKELVHKSDFAYRAGSCQDALPTADHTHDLKAFQGRPRGFYPLEAAGGSDHTLECAVIRLKDIVEIL